MMSVNLFKLLVAFICLSLITLFNLIQAASLTDQTREDVALDALVAQALQRHDVPGASIAVIKNGGLAWAKGYGLADPAQNRPVTPETVFEAASVTKSVVAWGIMNLVEDGLLDLDAPVEQYLTRWHLPPSEFDHDQVTLRRILSHTAGLSMDGDPGVEPGKAVPTLEEALSGAVQGMNALHVAYSPGQEFHYSSIGYALLELVIEEVSGERFAVYMQREILDPLGMTHSGFDWTPPLRAQVAIGHDWYNRPFPENIYATRGPGGLLTTASDLAIFVAASMPNDQGEPLGRGVLSPESVAEIFTMVPFANEAAHPIGLGYDLLLVDGVQVGAQKTGDNRGYKSIIVLAPQTGEGIALLTNGDRALVGFIFEVACSWSEQVAGHPMQESCQTLTTIPKVQLALAGVLLFSALVYLAFVGQGIRQGRRLLTWRTSWGKVTQVIVLLTVLVAWWLFWYTNILFTYILGIFPSAMAAVTVRVLVPWPTTFIWISWGVTVWLLVWMATVFVPKLKA